MTFLDDDLEAEFDDSKLEPVLYGAEDIGCTVLEGLTSGLYSERRHVIREYSQNEMDTKPAAKILRLHIDGPHLNIRGDGSGMDSVSLDIARKIGFSTKNRLDDIGWRGIGIWSGIAYCDRILISTKKSESKSKLLLSINARGLREEVANGANKPLTEVLSRNVTMREIRASEQISEHFTNVSLLNASPELLDVSGMKKYIGETLPVPFDPEKFPFKDQVESLIADNVRDYRPIEVTVNGERVFRPVDYKAYDSPKDGFIEDPTTGKTLAWYWYCRHKETKTIKGKDNSGIVFKQKGLTVGMRNAMSSLYPGRGSTALSWFLGEIHVLDYELVIDTKREDFEPNAARVTLHKGVGSLFKGMEESRREFSYRENVTDHIKDVQAAIESFNLNGNAEEIEIQRAQVRNARSNLISDRNNPLVTLWIKNKIDPLLEKSEEILSVSLAEPLPISAPSEKSLTTGRQSTILHEILEIIDQIVRPNKRERERLRTVLELRLQKYFE